MYIIKLVIIHSYNYSVIATASSLCRLAINYHMKKFAEVCLYNQCIIFIAAAINHVNINVY